MPANSSSAAFASSDQLVRVELELHAILGERLLEDHLALGQHARFLRALERFLRGLAELLEADVRRRLLLLQILDLRGDRLDLLIRRRLRGGDLFVDRLRRGARAEDYRQRDRRKSSGKLLHRLFFLSLRLAFSRDVDTLCTGGSVPR